MAKDIAGFPVYILLFSKDGHPGFKTIHLLFILILIKVQPLFLELEIMLRRLLITSVESIDLLK